MQRRSLHLFSKMTGLACTLNAGFLNPTRIFYLIRNAKSHYVITIKNRKTKEGAELVQEK